MSRTQSRSNLPLSSRRARLVAFVAVTLLTATSLAVYLPGPAWIVGNALLFGLPACAGIVVLREAVRIAVATALQFRLFGVHWGMGHCLRRGRWGRVEHRFAPIPLAADSRIGSARPQHHRSARWALCLGPPLCQSIVALVWLASDSFSLAALGAGFAPVVVLAATNLGLLAFHILIPFETPSGVPTDLRRILDLAFSGPEHDRTSRANVHAFLIEERLASGDIDAGRDQLDRALTQLGREPQLLQLEARIAQIEAAAEPAAAGRIAARTDPFLSSRVEWDASPTQLAIGARLMRGALGLSPLAIATTLFIALHSDGLIEDQHARWIREARAVAASADPSACEAQRSLLEERIDRLALFVRSSEARELEQLGEQAALHACAVNFEAAVHDQTLAVEIADSLRKSDRVVAELSDRQTAEAEVTYAAQLRQLAVWQSARGSYRDALRATGRAAQGLESADRRTAAWQVPADRSWALELFARERLELEATRTRIFAAMGTRG
jgi:hypothetical protein